MTELHALDNLPEHALPGEALPLASVLSLATLGLVLALLSASQLQRQAAAVAAAWPVGVALAPAYSAGPAPGGADAAPLSSTPTSGMALAAPAAGPPTVARPACPEPAAIHFATGRSVPEDNHLTPALAHLIDWARQHPEARIAVQGHADVVGVDEANVLLSYKRAMAVAGWLAEQGLPAQQVQVAAAGSHAPIEGLPGNAQANRRVTLQINNTDACLSPRR